MNVLCDTNAITALRLGNAVVLGALEQADTVLLSTVVLGELLYGFKNGGKLHENLRFLAAFKSKPRVQIIEVTEESAEVYSDLRLVLKKAGCPIPTNDLWIAAQTIAAGAILLTNDVHFSKLSGLRSMGF